MAVLRPPFWSPDMRSSSNTTIRSSVSNPSGRSPERNGPSGLGHSGGFLGGAGFGGGVSGTLCFW